MNRELRKIETPRTQTAQKKTLTQEQKNKFRKFKENFGWKKDLTIAKKHRLENSQEVN